MSEGRANGFGGMIARKKSAKRRLTRCDEMAGAVHEKSAQLATHTSSNRRRVRDAAAREKRATRRAAECDVGWSCCVVRKKSAAEPILAEPVFGGGASSSDRPCWRGPGGDGWRALSALEVLSRASYLAREKWRVEERCRSQSESGCGLVSGCCPIVSWCLLERPCTHSAWRGLRLRRSKQMGEKVGVERVELKGRRGFARAAARACAGGLGEKRGGGGAR